MQPLKLTLKGFRGIRDGLGLSELTLDLERLVGDAQLIAIAGPNGSGKTTVMDNLTPYLLLASRASTGGQGGFSYYDHVYLPESVKDLIWAHEGRCYRSQIVIRLSGRRKTEAFLHCLDDRGNWQSVTLEDGTISDGRMESYTACVESICGTAETFFTSVFASQGKRQLNTYRNAEIKSLLADLLGQAEIQRLGQQAGEVVRQLKVGLGTLRQEQATVTAERDRIAAAILALKDAPARVTQAEQKKQVAQSLLDDAVGRHVRLCAEFEQHRGTEGRRSELTADRRAEAEASSRSIQGLRSQIDANANRLEALERRALERRQHEHARRQSLLQARSKCVSDLEQSDAVARATRRLALARRVHGARKTLVRELLARVQAFHHEVSVVRSIEQKLASIERDVGKAVLRTEELTNRFGLTAKVPCAGTELQASCKLLADARDAQALIPDASALVARYRQLSSEGHSELKIARERCEALADAPRLLERAEHLEGLAGRRADDLQLLAAKAEFCMQCEGRLLEIEKELLALERVDGDSLLNAEEQVERSRMVESNQALDGQIQQERRRCEESLARIDRALQLLPAGCDASRIADAATALGRARDVLDAAQRSLLDAVRDAQMSADLRQQASTLAARSELGTAHCARVENEIANWNLLGRCLSNDGLIALAIDDAGPALSGLANDLLQACYGPRFTVAIQTQLETGKGELREGFDTVVHDGDTGEAKSMSLMSGGEKTWIEACLTRAIAIHLSMNTGRRYTTLFTDEADGALDIKRKRMFMAMKRKVLQLGGYEREYFVSQTPELTGLADAVIDLETLVGRDQVSRFATNMV